MKNLNQLLKILIQSDIDFVLIGGYAGVVHGVTALTRDLDICAAMTTENITKLRAALKTYNPKHRMNPEANISFLDEPKNIDNLNAIYLETDLGILDILSSVINVGDFQTLRNEAVQINVFGETCKVISLDHLIKAKEKMGRDKDKLALKELYLIRDKLKS